MGIEKAIGEIMADRQAQELSRALLRQVHQLPPPSGDEVEALSRVFTDISEDLPVYKALWMAFWLGAAWQNLRD